MHCISRRNEFFPDRETQQTTATDITMSPPPGRHLWLFGGGKNIKFYFPATTEQNITRVKLFRKPSDSSILMTIELSYHLLLSSLVGIDVVRTPDLGRGGAHQANF
jgi:hypothetical protein